MRRFSLMVAVALSAFPALELPTVIGRRSVATAAGPPKAFILEVGNVRSKTGRVPRGYGALGLTKEQKERVYGVQTAYAERISQLEEEIELLKREQVVRIKGILTEAQRLQIERYELATTQKKVPGGAGEE